MVKSYTDSTFPLYMFLLDTDTSHHIRQHSMTFLFRRGSYHPSFQFCSVASCGSSFDRAPPFPATRLRYAMLDLTTIFSAAGLQQELKSAHGDKSRLGWDGGGSLFGKSGWKLQNYRSTWNPRIAVSKRFKDFGQTQVLGFHLSFQGYSSATCESESTGPEGFMDQVLT